LTANSASAAAAQAAYDVLIGLLPKANTWDATRAWLKTQLAKDLTGVNANDPGIVAGHEAALAALKARIGDFSNTSAATYIPSTNLSINTTVTPNTIVANATGNPGIGVWRPSNGGAGDSDIFTGAPTGFKGGDIQAAAGINFNWKNVTLFSLTTFEKQQLVAAVPPSLKIGSPEYTHELDFVKTHGQDSAHSGSRTDDQLLQALYYKSDAELFTNEVARIASEARHFTLEQNAKLFAALDNAVADARIAAWQSKYDLLFWRPITAINADASGAATVYTWKPLATTPSHPSSTGGHSSTVAAGVEILRAFFESDKILPDHDNIPVTLTTLPWLIGTNNGTGRLQTPINSQDATTRDVSSFSQLQLENGRSRIYLGVHFANDDYQDQHLGLAVADSIIKKHKDPAVEDVSIYHGGHHVASAHNLYDIFVENSAHSGFYGLDTKEHEHDRDHDK
jgi:hypothetical protein